MPDPVGGREAEIVAVDVQRFKEAVWAVERENFRPGDALHALERATLRSSGSAVQNQEDPRIHVLENELRIAREKVEVWEREFHRLAARSPQDKDHEENPDV